MPGFLKSTTTPTPDEIFDVWLSELTGSELKVMLYIVRRTFGFGKDADAISLSQITNGIRKRNGQLLDRGTGLSRKSAYKAIQSLEERGVIKVDREMAEDGVNEINIYSLVFREGVGEFLPYGRGKSSRGVGEKVPSQETVLQETESQETDLSKFEGSPDRIREDIETHFQDTAQPDEKDEEPYSDNVVRTITDLSLHVLHDQEHLKSNITQAHNIWAQSELEEESFIEALYEAKQIVLKWSGNIRKLANEKEGIKNRAPYFFRVLRNLVLPNTS